MQRSRDYVLARAVLACNEHIRIRWTDARDQFDHRAHGGGLSDQSRPSVRSQQAILGLESLASPDGVGQFDLSLEDGEQPVVFPRLLNEILRPASHGLYREFEA